MKIAEQNLLVAFPQLSSEERLDLARRSFEHSALLALETMRLLVHPEKIRDMILPMSESLKQRLSEEGTIVCIPHLGNWEILAHAIPLEGIACSAVAETLNNRVLDKLMTKAREHNGLKIIFRKGAARKVLATLKRHETVGLLVDQNLSPDEGGVFASFFGVPASTVPLPALLARKLKIKVEILASIRTEDGRYKLIHSSLPKPVTDYASDLALTQDINHAFEKMISEYPEQYMWSYKRWRYLPSNIPEDKRSIFPSYAQIKNCDVQLELIDNLCSPKP